MTKIQNIIDDGYQIGDAIRIQCSLGIKEGSILEFCEDRIRLRPFDSSKKPISIKEESIGDYEEADLFEYRSDTRILSDENISDSLEQHIEQGNILDDVIDVFSHTEISDHNTNIVEEEINNDLEQKQIGNHSSVVMSANIGREKSVSPNEPTTKDESLIETDRTPNKYGLKIVGHIDLSRFDKKRKETEIPCKFKDDGIIEENETSENGEASSFDGTSITLGKYSVEWETIDLNSLLQKVNSAIASLPQLERTKMIAANAHVMEVCKCSFKVVTETEPSIGVNIKRVVETSLLNSISRFQVGDTLPVVVFFRHTTNHDFVSLALHPNTIEGYLDLLTKSLLEKHYIQSKKLCYFLLSNVLHSTFRKRLWGILSLLDTINIPKALDGSTKIDRSEYSKIPKDYKTIEKRLNELIKTGQHTTAISEIDDILEIQEIEPKYKSSLLLKRAQMYSSMMDYENAKISYMELIRHNELHNPSKNNLSHLYTELARLQSLNREDNDAAKESAKKALTYNPANKYAENLLKQLESGVDITVAAEASDGNKLVFDEESRTTTVISKMIDIDIKEHRYNDEDVLRNDGHPTPEIADAIFARADRTRDVDMSERYPAYLEAAKAYSELPTGSYDYQKYIDAVALYAILKGNSLFLRFKKYAQEQTHDLTVLTRLKDSACSYYIESLNLQAKLPSTYLLTILANYLKMHIALDDIKNGKIINFSGQFSKVFFDSIDSPDIEYNNYAWATILSVGSRSKLAWNSLSMAKGGTGGLYRRMMNELKRKEYYAIINKVGNLSISESLQPGEFLRQAFNARIECVSVFGNELSIIQKVGMDFRLIQNLKNGWDKINQWMYLLSPTEIESFNAGQQILKILSPYVSRNEDERTNLLIKTQGLLEQQISFIRENTTFYGRTFFSPVFDKWKKTVQEALSKKVADTLPVLEVLADPPYIVSKDNYKIVNLIIKNVGKSTAEGWELTPNITVPDTMKQYNAKVKICTEELPSGNIISLPLNLPEAVFEQSVLKLAITITAIYQGEKTATKQFCFTVEPEPETRLEYNEIVWNESKTAKGQMFKGRQQISETLTRHYRSIERDKPYILYGLTRTGKSSILEYLRQELDKTKMLIGGEEFVIATFSWELSEATSGGTAKDLWQYLLVEQVYENLNDYLGDDYLTFSISKEPRAKDLPRLLAFLQSKHIYPLFLVDEFSFIKTLIDKGIVNTAFLHTLRKHSLDGLASFIYAGTYDIKDLLTNPKYGITGQLVNAVDEHISYIDKESAEELMNVMEPQLCFTKEAVQHIHKLSGDIPYFIQIICRRCAFYAVENKRKTIGYPELENVIKVLTGENTIPQSSNSMLKTLPPNIFANNMFSPQDPPEVNVLITCIAYLNKGNRVNARNVSFVELQELWAEKKVTGFRSKLAEALKLLVEKRILVDELDDDLPVYHLSVDLFRRWWAVHHADIAMEIETLIKS